MPTHQPTDDSILERYFGKSAVLKIIDTLLHHPSLDYSKKELAEAAGISESTLHRHWNQIQALEIVEKTRKYGKTQLYSLNTDASTVKELFRLEQELEKKPDPQKSSTIHA